jgi:hypothetical protein
VIRSAARRTAFLLLIALAASRPLGAQAICAEPARLEESFRMGSLEGADALNDVRALELDQAGNIYLAQAWINWISVYDPRGKPVREIGGSGQGPGQFGLFPAALGWKGDTLWVVEPLVGTHLFGRDGKQIVQVSFRTPYPPESSTFNPGAMLRDGSFLGMRNLAIEFGKPGVGDYYTEGRRPILRFSAAGAILDTIAMVGWTSPRWVHYDLERSGRTVSVPKEHPLQQLASLWNPTNLPFTLTSDGAAVVFVDADAAVERAPFSPLRIYDRVVGSHGTFRLVQVAIDGDTIFERTIPYERQPITPADERWLREGFASQEAGDYAGGGPRSPFGASEAERARQRAAAGEGITFPEFHPPVRKVFAGADGTIWLLREIRPDRADLWEIYDRRGRLEGSVIVTEGRSGDAPWWPHVRVLRATRSEVWGMTLDDLDVPAVRRYRIVPVCL